MSQRSAKKERAAARRQNPEVIGTVRPGPNRRVWLALGIAVAALTLIGWLVVRASRPVPVDAAWLNDREAQIVQLIEQGRGDEGDKILLETEQRTPASAALLHHVGVAFLDHGDPARALILLQRAYALSPNDPVLRLSLGETLLETNRAAEALVFLEAAHASGAMPTNSGFALMKAYQVLNRPEEAKKVLASIPISDTLQGSDLVEIGVTGIDLQAPDVAERFLREAVKRAPSLATAHEHLGVAIGMQRKDLESVKALETAVNLDPGSATTYFRLAVANAENGRPAEARAAAERALLLKPDFPEASWLLSQLAQKK